MHTASHSSRLLVLAACLALAGPAAAAVFEGTFSGIARDSRVNLGPIVGIGSFDGEAVEGSFRFDTTNLSAPEYSGPDFMWTLVPPGSLTLVFNTIGRTLVFDQENDQSVGVWQTAQGPVVSLGTAGFAISFHKHATLALAGPLLDGLDLDTLRPAPVDLQRSFASLYIARDIEASVDLTRVSFGVSAIPEPQTPALAAAGLLALALAWRGRLSGHRAD